ncbi:RING-H2 finger protein ATL52 [Linum grandiflorum]
MSSAGAGTNANNSSDDDFNTKIAILLVGVGSAALVVTIYHCIAVGWCNRNNWGRGAGAGGQGNHPGTRRRFVTEVLEGSMESSTAELIPAYKFYKGMGLMKEDGGTCAICLCEFEEGEELKTLPECMHSFHVGCIDMWLYSHSNCPMCRTDAAPSPQVSFQAGDVMEVEQSLGVTLQGIIVHSRTNQ